MHAYTSKQSHLSADAHRLGTRSADRQDGCRRGVSTRMSRVRVLRGRRHVLPLGRVELRARCALPSPFVRRVPANYKLQLDRPTTQRNVYSTVDELRQMRVSGGF